MCPFDNPDRRGHGNSQCSLRRRQNRLALTQIAREAAQKFDEARLAGRTETNEQTRPTVPPAPPGARVELTLDDAVERALERNLDHRGRAAQSADLRLLARRARCDVPPEPGLHIRTSQPDVVHPQSDGRRRHPQHRHVDRQQRRHAEPEVGRRQLRGRRSTTTARSSPTCSPRATRRSTRTSTAAYQCSRCCATSASTPPARS